MPKIVCPQCQYQGFTYSRDGRKFFSCPTCGLHTLLKLLVMHKQETAKNRWGGSQDDLALLQPNL